MSNILIVDDEQEIVSLLELILLSAGHNILTANNGREALDKIAGNSVDILISDVQMPVMTGHELIREVNRLYPDISVIAITGYGDRETVVDLIKAGCREFVDKPFTEDEIIEAVDKLVFEQERSKERLSKVVADKDRRIAKLVADFSGLESQIKEAVVSYEDLLSINRSALPFDFYSKVRPLHDIGGDLLAVGTRPDGSTAVLIADVAGHDLSASYHAVLMKTLFQNYCEGTEDPSLFFAGVNNVLVSTDKQKMITAKLLIINKKQNELTVSNAAHPPLMHYSKASQEIQPIEISGDVIGILPDAEFSTTAISVGEGDRIFLFTDGLSEMKRVEGVSGVSETLNAEGLQKIFAKHISLPSEECVERIWDDVLSFSRYKVTDDLMLVGISLRGESADV